MKGNREIWRELIVIEGIDGAGTTTLGRLLTESIAGGGFRCRNDCEPTSGPVGRLIREALSGGISIDPRAMALLFAADRSGHVRGPNGIRELIDSGSYCVSDRYLFSSLAYQSLECEWEWVNQLNSEFPLPGYLIFLNIPVDEAQKRLATRAGRDLYDDGGLQTRIAESYVRSIGAYRESGMRILELDSRRPPGDLLSDSMEFLGDLLQSR